MPSPKKNLAGSPVQAGPGRQVSMRDVARAVGVSVSAVSLALKNSPRVSEGTRRKIQEKIAEMGYQPDPMLAALCHYRRGRSSAPIGAELAWINCWPEPNKLRTYREFEHCWQGAFEEARRNGFRLETITLKECGTFERMESILRARNIRGLLLPPTWHGNDPEWGGFPWAKFCMVRLGHSIHNLRAHIVASDQLMDGMIAFENIWKQGYRRIAFVATLGSSIRSARFSAGFLQGQLKVAAKLKLPPLMLDEINYQKDEAMFLAWLRKTRPDAIFTDLAYLPGMLAKAGYKVPRDIGLAATSVLDGNASAGIDQNSSEIGRAAVQMLISLINHNERGIPKICRELLVEGNWVNGDTLPPKT
jgi:DNA-binding LacI/PurR family transcriptional regulator